MSEQVFNLFVYVERNTVKELGVAVHEADGADSQKLSILQSLVEADCKTARRFKLAQAIEWPQYESMMRLGLQLQLFEDALKDCGASTEPLVVITPIVDNAPNILAVAGLGPLDLDQLQDTPLTGLGVMADYLKAYTQGKYFDAPRLINDDYFKAIKLLFNAGHYVSAAKLLLSCVDSIAFIDAGDVPHSFVRWLEAYADLPSIGITPQELWEFRNGLLHMTNLASRAVRNGTVARLIMCVGGIPEENRPNTKCEKYFNLRQLIDLVAAGLAKWLQTYNSDPAKVIEFVRRYYLTISDARLARVTVAP